MRHASSIAVVRPVFAAAVVRAVARLAIRALRRDAHLLPVERDEFLEDDVAAVQAPLFAVPSAPVRGPHGMLDVKGTATPRIASLAVAGSASKKELQALSLLHTPLGGLPFGIPSARGGVVAGTADPIPVASALCVLSGVFVPMLAVRDGGAPMRPRGPAAGELAEPSTRNAVSPSPVPFWGVVRVRWRELVPMRAVCLSPIACAVSFAAQDVLTARYRFQVARVHAAAIPAQVVKRGRRRNRADEPFVAIAVRAHIPAEDPIAATLRPSP